MATTNQSYTNQNTQSLGPLYELLVDSFYNIHGQGRDEMMRRMDLVIAFAAELSDTDFSTGIDDAVLPWQARLQALHLDDYVTAEGITWLTQVNDTVSIPPVPGFLPETPGAATSAEVQTGVQWFRNQARAYILPGVSERRALEGILTWGYFALGTSFLRQLTSTVLS